MAWGGEKENEGMREERERKRGKGLGITCRWIKMQKGLIKKKNEKQTNVEMNDKWEDNKKDDGK